MIAKLSTIDRLFIGLLIMVLIVSIPWHDGIKFCDSASYVYFAKKFLETLSIDYGNIYAMRVIAWLPYSVYIFFFGVSDAVTWVTTIEFCILLSTIYLLLRKYDRQIAFYSVVLLGFSTLMVKESTMAMGDMMVTLLVNLPILIYWRYVKNEEQPRALKFGMIAGMFWVFAFYAKESASYYLILCLYFSVVAYRKKLDDDIKFWSGFWRITILAGIASGGYFYFQTGDPFHKLRIANETIGEYGTRLFGKTDLLHRLTYQPITFFVYEYSMGILGLLGTFYVIHSWKFTNGFWREYFLVLLAVWWIFPQKSDPYYPMWLIYRLWLPLMVPLAICAGHGMKILISHQETKLDRIVLSVLGISAIAAYYFAFGCEERLHQKRILFYVIATFFLAISLFVRENNLMPKALKVITLLLLLGAFLINETNPFPEWKVVTLLALFFVFLIYESKRLPNLRKLAMVGILLPFFFQHYDRSLWNEDKSEYEQVGELIEILRKKHDTRTVLASYCFVEFTKLYDLGNMVFISYENDTVSIADSYLIVDEMLVDTFKARQKFLEVRGRHTIETMPLTLGFRLVEELERYQIYYHE